MPYDQIHKNYVAYCDKIGAIPLSFEDWMTVREGVFRATPRFSDILFFCDPVLEKHKT